MEPNTAATPPAQQRRFRLPVLVFGIVEVRRLQRELEVLDEFMRQMAIRSPGEQPLLPRMSRLCEGLAGDNGLNLLDAEHRATMTAFLKSVTDGAPRIHISFAADPSSAFVAKLVAWLRQSIHPFALLEIGLQPNIAAGCVVRTTNKLFDCSVRQRFAASESLLLQSFEAMAGEPAPAAQVVPAAAVPQGAAA